MAKVLFEQYYPRSERTAGLSQLECTNIGDPASHMSYEEIMVYLQEGLSYKPLPERKGSAEAFVQLAKSISQDYRVDVKIKEYDTHITVEAYLFDGGNMDCLRELFSLADDVNFFTHTLGYDLILSIDYYTQAVFRRGTQIHP